MTFPGRALFACWLTIAATGMDVTHRHTAGEGHTHGFGWTCLRTSQTGSCPLSHHHYVFCGIEFGAMGDQQDQSPDGVHAALTSDSLTADDHSVDGTASLHAVYLSTCHSLSFFDDGLTTSPAQPPPFTPLAPPTRSSVLRL